MLHFPALLDVIGTQHTSWVPWMTPGLNPPLQGERSSRPTSALPGFLYLMSSSVDIAPSTWPWITAWLLPIVLGPFRPSWIAQNGLPRPSIWLQIWLGAHVIKSTACQAFVITLVKGPLPSSIFHTTNKFCKVRFLKVFNSEYSNLLNFQHVSAF